MVPSYIFHCAEGEIVPLFELINVRTLRRAIDKKYDVYCKDFSVRIVISMRGKRFRGRNIYELLMAAKFFSAIPVLSEPLRTYSIEELKMLATQEFERRERLMGTNSRGALRLLSRCLTFEQVFAALTRGY